MVPYVIRQGDFLTKLAEQGGFDPDTVWTDPQNADLKSSRTNYDCLLPGDLIYLPEPKVKSIALNVGTTNDFTADVPLVKIQITLSQEGEPLANTPCRVEGVDDDPIQLTTDGDGMVSFQIPMDCDSAALVLDDPPGYYPVMVGHMDPETETSGICLRLVNLGYLDDPNADDDTLAESVRAFQSDNDLDATGEVDDATRDALVDAHGH